MTHRQKEAIPYEYRCNEWSHFETWVVYESTQSDEDSRNYWIETTIRTVQSAPQCLAVQHGSSTVEQAAKYSLAYKLQNVITQAGPELGNTLYADLLYSVLDTVNWLEISERMINDLP